MATKDNPKNEHDERRSKQEDFSIQLHHVYKFFLLSISFLLGMFKKKPIAACTLFFIIIQNRPVEGSH